MENKLQELTQKLYKEGLSKGQREGATLLTTAKKEADEIVAEAKKQAEEILKAARQSAADLKQNALSETVMASRDMIGQLKQQIEKLVILKGISPGVRAANADPQFVKDMLLAVAGNWNAGASNRTELSALLPADKQAEMQQVLEGAAATALGEGFEIKYDKKLKSGFKIGPRDGGYHISFTDADFDNLLSEYLRPQVAALLFEQQ